MVTTTNLNQGTDYLINLVIEAKDPIGSTSNNFIAIQRTFSDTIDYDLVYEGFCEDINSFTQKNSGNTY
jgi:hypothetical protein